MQIIRRQTVVFGIFFVVLLFGMLVLFSIRRTHSADTQPTGTPKSLEYILHDVLQSQIPSQSLQVSVDETKVYISAKLSRENLENILSSHNVSLPFFSQFLPDPISANIDLDLNLNEKPFSISVLRLELAEVDLTDILGDKLSETINRAVKNGLDSIDFHGQFT